MFRRIVASLLIAESLFAGVRVAGLLPALAGYDAVAILLILARGLLGAAQFTGGWMLAINRPPGAALAGTALPAAAVLTIFDVGLSLAPTGIYPWWRWQFTVAYGVYALVAAWYCRHRWK